MWVLFIVLLALLLYAGLNLLVSKIGEMRGSAGSVAMNETFTSQEGNLTEQAVEGKGMLPNWLTRESLRTYAFFSMLGLALLLLLLLLRIKWIKREKPRKKQTRIREGTKKLTQGRKIALLGFFVVVILVLLLLFCNVLAPVGVALWQAIILYWVYIVAGFVLLALLLFVLNRFSR